MIRGATCQIGLKESVLKVVTSKRKEPASSGSKVLSEVTTSECITVYRNVFASDEQCPARFGVLDAHQ